MTQMKIIYVTEIDISVRRCLKQCMMNFLGGFQDTVNLK